MIGWVKTAPGRGTIEPEATGPEWSGPATPAAAARRWILVMLVPLSAMFALVMSAYLMRRQVADWETMQLPWQLYLSTALLAASSAAFEWARRAAAIAHVGDIRRGLLVAGVAAFAFLGSQIWAWQVLRDLGYYLATNPANSFFYMITALHALHVVGGLVAWTRVNTLARSDDFARLEQNVTLCAIYWHFLFAVWLALFGVMLLYS
jgi:cytochrome c oxidase subunit III